MGDGDAHAGCRVRSASVFASRSPPPPPGPWASTAGLLLLHGPRRLRTWQTSQASMFHRRATAARAPICHMASHTGASHSRGASSSSRMPLNKSTLFAATKRATTTFMAVATARGVPFAPPSHSRFFEHLNSSCLSVSMPPPGPSPSRHGAAVPEPPSFFSRHQPTCSPCRSRSRAAVACRLDEPLQPFPTRMRGCNAGVARSAAAKEANDASSRRSRYARASAGAAASGCRERPLRSSPLAIAAVAQSSSSGAASMGRRAARAAAQVDPYLGNEMPRMQLAH